MTTNVLDELKLDEVLVRYSGLLEQIKALQAQAEAMRADALVRAGQAIRALMEQHGLSVEDMEDERPQRPRAPYGSKKKQREAAAEAARLN
ncbi:MAG: hypothetical protein ACXWVD_00365 [Telluria sp.]